MNRCPLYYFRHLAILILLAGCAVRSPFYADRSGIQDSSTEDSPIYSVYLIGDTGNTAPGSSNPPLEILRQKLSLAGERSAVVFLGDNLYPDGLPPEDAADRNQAEAKLLAQLDILQGYPGQIFFIPGNHDWNSSRKGGLEAVTRMEAYIESNLDRGNVFLPDNGFPGPVDIKLMDKDDDPLLTRDIHLIVLDTQWWLHPHEKSFGDNNSYFLHDDGDFLSELTDIMRNRQNDHLVVAGHHPMFSNGRHGGSFSLKTHLLPPLIGTGYVLYRKFFGTPQDISHYRYQSLRRELLVAFDQAESLVYASGHEHVLQHNVREGRRRKQHYVVSGSGSKTDYAAKGKGAEFVSTDRGFAVVNYYGDRSSWLEFWNEEGALLYRRQLLAPDDNLFLNLNSDSTASYPKPGILPTADSTVTIAANPKYDEAGRLRRAILGSHNRRLWSIPVEAPVFDLSEVRGGLEVIKLGGTGQSTTLRLTDSGGRTYVLRSIDKEAGRIWDASLRHTFAEDLAQDQFSIINPYGAFMMPALAEAVNVYHTKPELYVVPDDPRLGRFADEMKGRLVLFEERPDGDMTHAAHLSGSMEVLSTRDFFRAVDGDIDHRVDQYMMLRNRLLDMLVSDWDRHEDQWRWAAFEPADEKGKIYQPIPRDRDMAFIFMNGLVPTIGKISFFSHYQDFRNSYGNLKELTANSLSLTRRFTNRLTREEWGAVADSMKASLTDSVIEKAVALMPEPVADKHGGVISGTLKIRRDQLPEVALKYYDLISPVVDVVGSHKREKFLVESFSGDSVRVQVFKVKNDGEIGLRYYVRTFYAAETKELRLFGLGGDDLFEITNHAPGAIKIRMVGGSGSDEFIGSGTKSPSGRITVYDTGKGSSFKNMNVEGIKIRNSGQPEINKYDYRGGFRYNTVQPLLFFGSNRDDGLFVGGGARFTRHGFRKQPAAAIHRIRGNFAVETQAFNIRYDGIFGNLIGDWNGMLKADVLLPNNIRNFYGLGNETDDQNRLDDFYQARLQQYYLGPSVSRPIGTGISFSAGPYFRITKVREDEGRFVGQPQAGISKNTFEDQWFAGLQTNLSLQSVDNTENPKQGFRWNNDAMLNFGIKNTSETYSTLSSSLSMYISPVINPQLTFATRFGLQHNVGPFPFYEANTLGGKRTLRGLLSNRYAGRTVFFNNIEMRTKLFDFHNYLLGGEVGLLGFFDHGRVWTDGERSKRWHYGSGGGAWISVFEIAVVRGSIGFSEKSYNVLIGAGFFF